MPVMSKGNTMLGGRTQTVSEKPKNKVVGKNGIALVTLMSKS